MHIKHKLWYHTQLNEQISRTLLKGQINVIYVKRIQYLSSFLIFELTRRLNTTPMLHLKQVPVRDSRIVMTDENITYSSPSAEITIPKHDN